MKGWLACLSTLASVTAYLICFCNIKVFFFNALRAYSFPVRRCRARNTFPKAPDPSVLMISKEEKVVLSVVMLLSSLASSLLAPSKLCLDGLRFS